MKGKKYWKARCLVAEEDLDDLRLAQVEWDEFKREHVACKTHIERLEKAYASASALIVAMHSAAMGGKICGPKRGVVEDIQDLYRKANGVP